MIKVVNKGYTITVVSWENDGDNYNTKSKTVDTLDKAQTYYDMMQLCKCKHDSRKITLGNTLDSFSSAQEGVILNFLKKNPTLLEGDDVENADDEDLVDWFVEIAYELLGGGEFLCRVMESCTVTYSDKDIFVEEVKLK